MYVSLSYNENRFLNFTSKSRTTLQIYQIHATSQTSVLFAHPYFIPTFFVQFKFSIAQSHYLTSFLSLSRRSSRSPTFCRHLLFFSLKHTFFKHTYVTLSCSQNTKLETRNCIRPNNSIKFRKNFITS